MDVHTYYYDLKYIQAVFIILCQLFNESLLRLTVPITNHRIVLGLSEDPIMCENPYYTAAQHGDFDLFELEDFALEQGATLRNASLAYKTFGQLNKEADNAILFPVMFSGTHAAMASYVGNELALNPEKYFIIIPNQLGGGLSTSPHNTQGAYGGASFPMLSIGDDVRAQHKLLTEHFGIDTLQLVTGWSMGAQQTYEWAVRYPDMVARALPIAGTAKTTPHCSLYVDVFCEALSSDPAWENGAYTNANKVCDGLSRMARVFAMMGVSHGMFNEKYWSNFGFSSTEDFLAGFWESWFLPMDPNNLLCMATKQQLAPYHNSFDVKDMVDLRR